MNSNSRSIKENSSIPTSRSIMSKTQLRFSKGFASTDRDIQRSSQTHRNLNSSLKTDSNFYLFELKKHIAHRRADSDIFKENEIPRSFMKDTGFEQQLPLSIRKFLVKVPLFKSFVKEIENGLFCLANVAENVRSYRPEMGNLCDNSFATFSALFNKLLSYCSNQEDKFETAIENQLNKQNNEILKWQAKSNALKEDYHRMKEYVELKNREYAICKENLDSMQQEIFLLQDLLKKDLLLALGYLNDMNERKPGETTDPSNILFSKIEEVNEIARELEDEHRERSNLFERMALLSKKMIFSSKSNKETQVDEGMLPWNNKNISSIEKMSMMLEIDLELKAEKDGASIEFTLPLNLVKLIQDTQNKSSSVKVVPYLYFKKQIIEILDARHKNLEKLKNFEQFFCSFFFQKHQNASVAIPKILEFLASLKFYCKYWPRAIIFCYILGCMEYLKPTPCDTFFQYKFDNYFEIYILHVINSLHQREFIRECDDGFSLLQKEFFDSNYKKVFEFFPDSQIKRLYGKCVKNIRKENLIEEIDFDKIIEFAIDEYFEARKKMARNLTKELSILLESNSYDLSFNEYESLFFIQNNDSPNFYETDTFILASTFYSAYIKSDVTTTGNLMKSILDSIQEFGVDCPYPCKVKINHQKNNNDGKDIENKLINRGDLTDRSSIDSRKKLINDETNLSKNLKIHLKNQSSKIFSQHYSILRELNHYCQQFQDSVNKKNDPEILFKNFENISIIVSNALNLIKIPSTI